MAAKEYPAGTRLIQREQPINALHVVTKGCVHATYPGGEFYLYKGDVIGACELSSDTHFISYQVQDTACVASYPCSGNKLDLLLSGSSDFAGLVLSCMFKQIREILDQYEMVRFDCENSHQYLMDSYNEYTDFCSKHSLPVRALPGLDEISDLVLEEDVVPWLSEYYRSLSELTAGKKELSTEFLRGTLVKGSEDTLSIISVCRALEEYKAETTSILMNENRLDFFDLYASILYKIGPNAEDSQKIVASISNIMIQLEGQSCIDQDMYKVRVSEYKEKLASVEEYLETHEGEPEEAGASQEASKEIINSMHTILQYAGCDDELAANFKTAVAKYKKAKDKSSTDDDFRHLRLSITKMFYQIYNKAFLRSLHDITIPKVIQMFFNFGYVDEELAGMENAVYLYSIIDSLPTNPDHRVYSIYEWLRAIYDGRKTPSRNEFDVDYVSYVHEQKVTGKISPAQELVMLSDQEAQVKFELENMFVSVNKISYGRVTTFCPIFSEHNILKDLKNTLVTAEKVEQNINAIRSVDFSAFYRDTVYTNPELGIGKEFISVEVLPDIILMPNVGVRGVMWQEIEGRKRTTPSRMMLSIFQMEDLTQMLVRMTGEYRWEMCKRVQGARWNDITDPSLTSEYFDYIQFYKKSHDLSPDAKDKIKLAMQKAKNSFKEMFIRDYISWVIFEANGAPRLNKVSRTILFKYCPFPKDIRAKLMTNPQYTEMLKRYEVKLSQKLHHYANIYQKISNSGNSIPEELQSQKSFLEM